MTERRAMTKMEMLADIKQAWTELNTVLERLTEAQITTPRDAQGWTVKDHIIHMTAWERSVVFFLLGKPRYEGLGVDRAAYLRDNDDEINAIIYQQQKNLPLADALAQFRSTHQQLLELLQPMTDIDLRKPYQYYLPDEPGDDKRSSAINVIYGNSAQHFTEHLAWIETLVGQAS